MDEQNDGALGAPYLGCAFGDGCVRPRLHADGYPRILLATRRPGAVVRRGARPPMGRVRVVRDLDLYQTYGDATERDI